MRLLTSFALLLAAAAPAHAMGVYITFDVVAWNADGSAALVARTGSSSGTAGTSHTYELVAAGEKDPLVVSFDNTQDPDKATQHVDAKACRAAVASLKAALASHKFAGVTLRPEGCDDAKRDVLSVSADAQREATKSLVANSGPRASAREDLGIDEGTIALTSGKLALVLSGLNGDDSGPAHVAAYERSGARFYTLLIDDLRYH